MHRRAVSLALGGVSEACWHIVSGQFRIIGEDFVERHPAGQPTQDILDGNPQPSDAGLAATFAGFQSDDRTVVDHEIIPLADKLTERSHLNRSGR